MSSLIPLPLTDEQRAAINTVKKFCETKVIPNMEALDDEKMMPTELIKDFLQNVYGASEIQSVQDIEERRKERDKDWLTYTMMYIELSKVSPALSMSFGASLGLFGGTVLMHGTMEQKEKYALPVFRGEKIGCWGLTEPDAGSDVFGMKAKAARDGDDYILNGSKMFISNAPIADFAVVYAKTDPKASGHRGITAFILERGMEGLTFSAPLKKMGMRGSPTGAIFMDNVRVSKSQVLGTVDKGFYELLMTLKEERTGITGMAVAIIERCLEDSLQYAAKRAQFGQNIIFFQAIQMKLARMFMHLQNCYSLLFWLHDLQQRGIDSMASPAAAKIYSSEAAVECAMEAVQIMGGYGYMREYGVEMLARDAKLLTIGGGTNEIQHFIIMSELTQKAIGMKIK